MGGGTTLVEGLLAGLDVVGSDLNPIAVLVARERTRLRSPAQALRVLGEARRIAGQVEALRRERKPPRLQLAELHRITPHYAPHLLAELMQWLRLVNGLDPSDTRETLRAVFSSAVVKFSNQASDSSSELRPSPSVAKGAVTRFLVAKCEQLVQAQVDLARRVPRRGQVRLLQEDARLLPTLGWGEVDWILTSPPYPGVYDYHQHHRLRMDWLELDDQPLLQGELAPRRAQGALAEEPGRSLSSEFRDVLGTLARVLKPGGGLLLVVGDWLDRGHAVNGAAVLRRAAQDKGWRVESWAAMRRETRSRPERRAYARLGKWEHLLYLVRL
ncbi:MAG TPA: hypothetical protein VL359_14570 [bacterium]|nr:hypothetical protein [bacterium]